MKNIDGNKEEIEHGHDQLLWGNNQFESGILTIGSGEEAADGTVLTRDGTSGKYKVASSAAGALFVLVDRRTFSDAGDYPVRVCIAGNLNRERVKLAGGELTDADCDALRSYGIIAEKSVKA